MAEAIAELHGYPNGLIVHDDIQLSQFLFNQNRTRLILNDFNRAEFPLFDEKADDYCRYKNGRGGGNWRAPEEYRDDPLLEEIDVWSMVRLDIARVCGKSGTFGSLTRVFCCPL
jgi:serine/threonine protein kinase